MLFRSLIIIFTKRGPDKAIATLVLGATADKKFPKETDAWALKIIIPVHIKKLTMLSFKLLIQKTTHMKINGMNINKGTSRITLDK